MVVYMIFAAFSFLELDEYKCSKSTALSSEPSLTDFSIAVSNILSLLFVLDVFLMANDAMLYDFKSIALSKAFLRILSLS